MNGTSRSETSIERGVNRTIVLRTSRRRPRTKPLRGLHLSATIMLRHQDHLQVIDSLHQLHVVDLLDHLRRSRVVQTHGLIKDR